MTSYEKVKEFHEMFEQLINTKPTLVDAKTANLRLLLIAEEYNELRHAIKQNDIVEIADALADLQYVVIGAAVSYGIPLEEVFEEVHRSNMTKVGGYKRNDGKWIKPLSYESPNIARILGRKEAEK